MQPVILRSSPLGHAHPDGRHDLCYVGIDGTCLANASPVQQEMYADKLQDHDEVNLMLPGSLQCSSGVTTRGVYIQRNEEDCIATSCVTMQTTHGPMWTKLGCLVRRCHVVVHACHVLAHAS